MLVDYDKPLQMDICVLSKPLQCNHAALFTALAATSTNSYRLISYTSYETRYAGSAAWWWSVSGHSGAHAHIEREMLAASRSTLWHRTVAIGARGPAGHALLPQFLLRDTSAMRISTAIVKTSSACAKRSTAMTTRFSTSAGSSSSSHSSTSTGAHNAVSAAKEKSMSHFERLKDLWRKYGIVAIGTYFSMYGIVLGSIYVAIDQGWVRTAKTSRGSDSDNADNNDFNVVTATNKFVTFAEDLGIAKYLEVERVNAKTGTFLLAWVATKFTEPVRLAITLAITPRIARFLRRAPPKP